MQRTQSQWIPRHSRRLGGKVLRSFTKCGLVLQLATPLFLSPLLSSQQIELENLHGSISIRSVMGLERLELSATSPDGDRRDEVLELAQSHRNVVIHCRPKDNSSINVDIVIPHTSVLRAVTSKGAIRLSGLVRWAQFDTESGDIEIEGPLDFVRLRMLSDSPPRSLLKPRRRGIMYVEGRRENLWAFADLPPSAMRSSVLGQSLLDRFWSSSRMGSYSSVLIRANTPGTVQILDAPLPAESWVRPPSDAKRLADSPVRATTGYQQSPPRNGSPNTSAIEPTFRADVRLVTIPVTVHDERGQPRAGLNEKDFVISEDGVEQRIAFASPESAPLDITLLLDLSDSTLGGRNALLNAASRFLELAREGDRVGIFALGENLFHTVSPHSTDFARIRGAIDSMPSVGGSTALYDSILLSAHATPTNDPRRKSVLVVITDGHDTRSSPVFLPGGSTISYKELERTLFEWPVLVHTVLVRGTSFDPRANRTAERRMRQLAESTGGRLFLATPDELTGRAFAELSTDLRSIYALSYYPKNQRFDGKWRQVRVQTGAGRLPRVRNGYFAK